MIVQLKTQISTLEQWCRTIFGTSAGLDSQRDRRKTERSRTLKYCRIFCKYFPLCQKLVNKMITTQIWWPRPCIQRDRGSRCRHWGTWWNGLTDELLLSFWLVLTDKLFFVVVVTKRDEMMATSRWMQFLKSVLEFMLSLYYCLYLQVSYLSLLVFCICICIYP